jgi:hypothetical protein
VLAPRSSSAFARGRRPSDQPAKERSASAAAASAPSVPVDRSRTRSVGTRAPAQRTPERRSHGRAVGLFHEFVRHGCLPKNRASLGTISLLRRASGARLRGVRVRSETRKRVSSCVEVLLEDANVYSRAVRLLSERVRVRSSSNTALSERVRVLSSSKQELSERIRVLLGSITARSQARPSTPRPRKARSRPRLRTSRPQNVLLERANVLPKQKNGASPTTTRSPPSAPTRRAAGPILPDSVHGDLKGRWRSRRLSPS